MTSHLYIYHLAVALSAREADAIAQADLGWTARLERGRRFLVNARGEKVRLVFGAGDLRGMPAGTKLYQFGRYYERADWREIHDMARARQFDFLTAAEAAAEKPG